MKLRQILEAKYAGDTGEIELTQAPRVPSPDMKKFERLVSDKWPYEVLYKGENVFKQIYESGLVGFLQKQLHEEITERNDVRNSEVDSQESYLGYVVSEDMFVMGFDVWAEVRDDYYDHWDEESEDEEEYTQESVENMIMFELKCAAPGNCGPEDWHVLDIPAGMMYPRGLRELHELYPSTIDVRLD